MHNLFLITQLDVVNNFVRSRSLVITYSYDSHLLNTQKHKRGSGQKFKKPHEFGVKTALLNVNEGLLSVVTVNPSSPPFAVGVICTFGGDVSPKRLLWQKEAALSIRE